MAEVPVPKTTKARYFSIRFKEVFEILFLLLVARVVNCNIKAVGIAEVFSSVTIIIKSGHYSICAGIEDF